MRLSCRGKRVRTNLSLKRPFFASSTDHSQLLAQAQVYKLSPCTVHSSTAILQPYVMAAAGSDSILVAKVPHLHLARLYVDEHTGTLMGAKVINHTLGSVTEVCGKLVDAALSDLGGRPVTAKSTLHGLSGWVASASSKQKELWCTDLLKLSLDSLAWKTVLEIAVHDHSLVEESIYDQARREWEQMAREYVAKGLSAETELYKSRGATLSSIEHRADISPYNGTSGGAMAIMKF